MRRLLPLPLFAVLACASPKVPAVPEATPAAVSHAGCDDSPAVATEASTLSPALASTSTVAPVEAALPPPGLILGDASPAPVVAPTVRIESPASSAHVEADGSVTLQVTAWPTAEGAAHVHLILDNQPYKPIYDTGAPVRLRDLNGGNALAPGPHVLVAFASRANHESVKSPGALAVTPFVVGAEPAAFDAPKAFLVFSRPKGTYAGPQANHVLVDFQLVGLALGEKGSSVAIEVRSDKLAAPLRARATHFGKPFYLENLPSGSYEIELHLLDAAGKLSAGAWNKTVRTIVVDRAKKV